jgi:DNA-binding MarR family transcriptional regulator
VSVPADRDALWRDLRGLVIDGLDGYRRQVSEASGLPFSRVRALRRLDRLGPLSHAALAEAMMVDRPAVTGVVDDLCARGLARRDGHPTDRRSKLVSLTAAGRALVHTVEAVVPPPPPGWDELPATDLAALRRVLRALSDARWHASEPTPERQPAPTP